MRPPRGTKWRKATACAALMTAAALAAPGAGAQSVSATTAAMQLAARSPIVLSGTILRLKASDEPLLPPTAATAVIRVDRMLSGTELVGDQSGRTATVILKNPNGAKVGSSGLFFGNLRFAGKSITVADEGEMTSPSGGNALRPDFEVAIARGVQTRRDAPVRARLSAANVVFRGTVLSERPLESSNPENAARAAREEHDPDWHIASVRVTSALRGTQKDALVPVVFPASQDIAWVNSPKLRPGQDVIVAAHRPTNEELQLLQSTGVLRAFDDSRTELVTQPYDVLPGEAERRVNSLM